MSTGSDFSHSLHTAPAHCSKTITELILLISFRIIDNCFIVRHLIAPTNYRNYLQSYFSITSVVRRYVLEAGHGEFECKPQAHSNLILCHHSSTKAGRILFQSQEYLEERRREYTRRSFLQKLP